MFNAWFDRCRDDRYQQGCRDRTDGLLPRLDDSAYLSGYFSNRPEGLDEIVQHFSSVEDYLIWKRKTLKPGY